MRTMMHKHEVHRRDMKYVHTFTHIMHMNRFSYRDQEIRRGNRFHVDVVIGKGLAVTCNVVHAIPRKAISN